MTEAARAEHGVARDVQMSLIEGHDKGIGPMPTSVVHGLNGDLLASVAGLYLTGSVLDVTYGKGVWWTKYRPAGLAHHDLALDGVDFRALPEADRSYDTVCFDPPYLPRTGQSKATHLRDERFRTRYGLDVPRNQGELGELIGAGLAECARVARRWVLVKCCDYCNGKQLVLGHVKVLEQAAQLNLAVHDLLVHASGTGPGGGQILTARRARRAHSYLLVFRVGGRRAAS
jgi:hypothetical protein